MTLRCIVVQFWKNFPPPLSLSSLEIEGSEGGEGGVVT